LIVSEVYILIVAALALSGGLLVFLSRRLLHAVLALTFVFIGSALVFVFLGEVFIALLQLFVFVGGFSTYLIVAVASETSHDSFSKARFLSALVIIAIGIALILAWAGAGSFTHGSSFPSIAAAAISEYYVVFFMMLLLLFSAVIGSVLIMRRFVKLIV
jgi:NADH:ubiquinone oxidoreductase subunit 6 (subunit J)